MANPAAELAAYKVAVNANVTTKVTVDSISPVDVGDIGTDLADLLLPYLESINNEGITGGDTAPDDLNGQDLDLYFRINGTTFTLYRKEGGTWVEKLSLPFGVTFPDGPLSVRDFIDEDVVTVTAGSWAINNVLYATAISTTFNIPAPDLNFGRIDLIYAGTDGTIQYLEGVASSDPAFPDLPADTIAIDYVVVPSGASGNAPYLFYGSSAGTVNTSAGYTPIEIPVPSGTSTDIVIDWQTDVPSGQTKTYAQIFGNRVTGFTGWYEASANNWMLDGGALQPVIVFAGLDVDTLTIPAGYDNSVNRKALIS